MHGRIFNVQRFCTSDGPGIRTAVFFKGCPLRCVWCHNPESQRGESEILFYENECVSCGRCRGVTAESTDFSCYARAKEICGKTVSSDEIITEVMKDKPFYENSGGGITLSGGEPLFQSEFALDILKKCKENGLHTAVETCGFASRSTIDQVARYTDLFLFDFKEGNPQLHESFTGVSNKIIFENLRLLNELGRDIILRCPIIPSYNARQENYDKIAEIASSLESIKEIEIEPYHAIGEGKYKALGRNTPKIAVPTDIMINEIKDYIRAKTRVAVK